MLHDLTGLPRRIAAVLALICPIFQIWGCAAQPLSWQVQHPPAARDYGPVFDRWTRHGRVLDLHEFDTVLMVHATLRAPEFQQAFLAKYLDAYQFKDPADQQRAITAEHERVSGTADHPLGPTFLIQVESHSYYYGDLNPLKSNWRIALIDDQGLETTPTSVESVKGPRAIEVALYGQGSPPPLARTYYVQFPAQRADGRPTFRPDARALTLRIAGPPGKTDLVWTLQ